MVVPRRSFESQRSLPAAERDVLRHCLVVYHLFPNTMVFRQPDHVLLWHIFPDDHRVDRCRMHVSMFMAAPVDNERQARRARVHMQRSLEITEDEDFFVGEAMQRHFDSGAQSHLVFGRNEPGLAHFHDQIEAALAGASP